MTRYRNYTPTHRYTAPDGTKHATRSFLAYTHVLIGRRDLKALHDFWVTTNKLDRDAVISKMSDKYVVLQWMTDPNQADLHILHWKDNFYIDIQVQEIQKKFFK